MVGGPEPFTEAEGLGGFAVALILDPDHLATARRSPGILAMPDGPLTSRLGDLADAPARRAIEDAIAAQGFTRQQVTQALGGNLANASLLSVLRFMCSIRRKPRYDRERDEIVLDGPVRASGRDLPLPPVAGGAFPTTSVLDTFTGTNGTSPPNSNWTNQADGASGGLEIQSNACARAAAASWGTGYWNAATFDAHSEAFAELVDLGNYRAVGVRCDPGARDFYCHFHTPGDRSEVNLVDGGSYSRLGALVTSVGWVVGDDLGIDADGSTITAYRNSTALYTRSDSTLTGGGRIMAYVEDNVAALDDFGGGTVVVASAAQPMLMTMGVGS